jgi:hypothetical protein
MNEPWLCKIASNRSTTSCAERPTSIIGMGIYEVASRAQQPRVLNESRYSVLLQGAKENRVPHNSTPHHDLVLGSTTPNSTTYYPYLVVTVVRSRRASHLHNRRLPDPAPAVCIHSGNFSQVPSGKTPRTMRLSRSSSSSSYLILLNTSFQVLTLWFSSSSPGWTVLLLALNYGETPSI